MSTEENKALVRETFEEMWNKGNLSAIEKVYSHDYVGHDPALPEPIKGIEGAKQYVTMFRSAFPDAHVTFEDQLAEGDRVVTRYTGTGTHKGDLMGIAPTGKHVSVSGVVIDRISGNKIVEEWILDDNLGMLRQLGVVPAP